MIMAASEEPIAIRVYEDRDYDQVVDLFVRINRGLAPAEMHGLFEQYISTAINGELKQLRDIFSEAKRNAFWAVEIGEKIVGTFGIEAYDSNSTELRRMYLDERYRGRGIAQLMLDCAEAWALELGFPKMILSTAEVQKAAIAFYRRSGYRLTKTERADAMSTKTVGSDLTRFYFEKEL
jgi:RimJ/RimL family protein N-acetyltransferase